jgi:hypothetical protein
VEQEWYAEVAYVWVLVGSCYWAVFSEGLAAGVEVRFWSLYLLGGVWVGLLDLLVSHEDC